MAQAPTGTPTLRALLRRRDLGLELVLAESELDDGALDAPVRWVHNSDLADPTPFLSEGLALLTTGTQFADHDEPGAYDAYVQRLAARGVAGLGFGTDVVRAGVPPLLTAACRSARMPLFAVPYRTPFIAVARANAEAIAAEAYARRSWALAAQRAIALAALRPDGLTATLAELARQLDTWVGLFDAAGEPSHEHPVGALDASVRAALSAEVAAVLRRGARAGSSLRIGERPFTLQTLGRGGHLRGVIAIAAAELDQEGRGVVTAVIAMAGLALEQQEGVGRARALLRTGVLQSLMSGDPTLGRAVARDMWGGLPAAPVLVAVADASARRDAVAEWLELRAHDDGRALFFGRDEGRMVLVVPAEEATPAGGAVASPDGAVAASGRGTSGGAGASPAARVVDELAARFGVRVGVSMPVAYASFADALQQAEAALQRGATAVTRFAEVAASGVLAALDSDEGRARARAALAAVAHSDEVEGTELVHTLRTWLAHDARFDAAAAALGVHRHTVRARVSHAQRLLDVDLSSFAARAELWAALEVLAR